MGSVEGRNIFEPEFTVSAHSPVNLHLYDSHGRHTGPDITGKINIELGDRIVATCVKPVYNTIMIPIAGIPPGSIPIVTGIWILSF